MTGSSDWAISQFLLPSPQEVVRFLPLFLSHFGVGRGMHCEQANLQVGFGWLVGFPRPLFIPPGARFKNNQTGPFLARVVCVCVLFSRSLAWTLNRGTRKKMQPEMVAHFWEKSDSLGSRPRLFRLSDFWGTFPSGRAQSTPSALLSVAL